MFGIRYRYVLILLLAAYSYVNIVFTGGERLVDFDVPRSYLFGILFLVVFLVWELNRWTERNVEKLRRLSNHRVHPLIIIFLFSIVFVIIVSSLSLLLLYTLMDMPYPWDASHLKLLMAFGFRVNLFLNCVNAIVFFMNQLKKTQVEAEEFKKISIEAQFEALRNQVNPHFLFNCFNVLSTLVYKDADTSAKFIAQLSNVYRYLLFSQEKKMVEVAEELRFIQSYLYLLQIRFANNLHVSNNLDSSINGFYIAPASLQMLIENAIKHNVISRKNPLHIRLYQEGNFLCVFNNLQEKEVKEPSTQVGLKNIQSRYEFLSNDPVVVERSDSAFIVKIPLLKLEDK